MPDFTSPSDEATHYQDQYDAVNNLLLLSLKGRRVQFTDLSREGLGFLRHPELLVEQARVYHALREDALDPLRRRQRAAVKSTCSPPYIQ